ncbi:Stabilin-2 [Portunus trituberculatus]|uniref:Stabilin-2 n=1 Tax=Portunus trituberculatus TaxID=210409 RepID=A0A5B7FPZ2_PORTR|nr:Stabilin-2 [Portunus trituberculatus]
MPEEGEEEEFFSGGKSGLDLACRYSSCGFYMPQSPVGTHCACTHYIQTPILAMVSSSSMASNYLRMIDECNSVVDCDVNAQCLYDSSSQRYKCVCNAGYEGDGHICTTSGEAGCNIVNNCDLNANCIYDTYALSYRCQCRDGYEGDGLFCSPVQIGCNVLQNCGKNAVCSYNIEAQGYRCKCQEYVLSTF